MTSTNLLFFTTRKTNGYCIGFHERVEKLEYHLFLFFTSKMNGYFMDYEKWSEAVQLVAATKYRSSTGHDWDQTESIW